VTKSNFFQRMLAADMFKRPSGKIDIPDVSGATGREFLFYCYTGHVQFTAVTKVPSILISSVGDP
jgi:hypothetical protein